jgi:hypothetical protein
LVLVFALCSVGLVTVLVLGLSVSRFLLLVLGLVLGLSVRLGLLFVLGLGACLAFVLLLSSSLVEF